MPRTSIIWPISSSSVRCLRRDALSFQVIGVLEAQLGLKLEPVRTPVVVM